MPSIGSRTSQGRKAPNAGVPHRDDKWRLAMIAAQLVAVGQPEREALEQAFKLVSHAAIYLEGKVPLTPKQLWPLARRFVTLRMLLDQFHLKRHTEVRKYLFAIEDSATAERIWKLALKGDPVFDQFLVGRLEAYRKERITKRQKLAAEGRKKNIVK